jgi:phage terminase large subunit
MITVREKTLVLCTREYQKSIGNSVHRLISDTIKRLGLELYFTIKKQTIVAHNGSEFVFEGIRMNVDSIRSLEGANIVWVEEAAKVTKNSWEILIPTIRAEGSQIWVSFNPDLDCDETYRRFVLDQPHSSKIVQITYKDNKRLTETSRLDILDIKKKDYATYLHVWEGQTKKMTEAVIFKGKFLVKEFSFPDRGQYYLNRYFFGADWGFSNDPLAFIRCFIIENILYIDYESGGIKIDMWDIKAKFLEIPQALRWPILSDCARPETISYMKREGFRIAGAEKWKGSVEDGIEYIKGFEKVVIHPRCKNTIAEFSTYSFKVDPNNEDILRDIVDADNHYIDALRYALSTYIKTDVSILEAVSEDNENKKKEKDKKKEKKVALLDVV